MMAARVAADLAEEAEVSVERVKGGLGEFSVTIDESKVYESSRLWYPNPATVLKKARAVLANKSIDAK